MKYIKKQKQNKCPVCHKFIEPDKDFCLEHARIVGLSYYIEKGGKIVLTELSKKKLSTVDKSIQPAV